MNIAILLGVLLQAVNSPNEVKPASTEKLALSRFSAELDVTNALFNNCQDIQKTLSDHPNANDPDLRQTKITVMHTACSNAVAHMDI
jgi:hypothetical protein